MHTNVKTSNRKELQLKILVYSGYIHTGIEKQLAKGRIKTEQMDRSFEVFNTDGTKNGEVTRFILLELEINRHTERINAAVTDLNGMNIFLGYN